MNDRGKQEDERSSFTISELCNEFGITTRTIRFYEDQGLLNPERVGRWRIYSRRDRTRLILILRSKRVGFTLGEIRELFDLYDKSGKGETQLMRFLNILGQRREILENQRDDIRAILQEINQVEAACRDAKPGAEPRDGDRKGVTSISYNISQLSQEFGVSTRTIRFYEGQGMLEPKRVGRWRIYSRRDYTRLKLILRGRRLGFSLSEMRELNELYDRARESDQQERVLKLLARQREVMQGQRYDIEDILKEIEGWEQRTRDELQALQQRKQTA